MISKEIFSDLVYRISDMLFCGFEDTTIIHLLGPLKENKEFELYFKAALNIAKSGNRKQQIDVLYSSVDISKELQKLWTEQTGK